MKIQIQLMNTNILLPFIYFKTKDIPKYTTLKGNFEIEAEKSFLIFF